MKRVLGILGIVIVLILAAAILLPIIYKDKIINLAKSEINRKVNAKIDFSNDIDVSIWHSFPNLSLTLRDIKVINKAPFDGDTLTVIPQMDMTLDIMSVIKGRKMQVKSFELTRPYINLKVDSSGVANWDIALPDKDSLAKKGVDTTSNFRMALQHYAINNGRIVYDDQSIGFFIGMDSVNHTGSGDFTADVFDLDTKTKAAHTTMSYGGVPYIYKAATDLNAKLNMDMKNWKFTFKENELKLNDLALGFDGWLAMPTDDINMDITWKAKKTDFKTLLSMVPAIYSKDFGSLRASGNMALNGFVKGVYSDKSFPGFNLTMRVDNGMFQYPDLPSPVNDVFVDMKVDNPGGDLNNTVVNIQKAHFAMSGSPFDARLMVKTPMSDPYLDGAVKGTIVLDKMKDVIKLDQGTKLTGTLDADVAMKGNMSAIENQQYDKFYASGYIDGKGMNYASTDLPQPVNINTIRLDFNPKDVKMSNLNLTMGPSDLQGEGSIHNLLGYWLKDQKLAGNLNIRSTYFDVNPWMAPSSSTASTQPAESKPMEAIELPSNIDFTMNADMKRVLYDKMDIKDLKGVLVLKDKKLEMQNVAMNTLGGSFLASGYYDSKNPNQPVTDMKLSIKNVAIPDLYKTFVSVQAFAPIAKFMTGNISADLNVNTLLGKDMMPILSSLNSNGKLNIPYASISNFLPLTQIGDKVNLEKFKNLSIKDIRPSFSIKDGRFKLNEPIKFVVDQVKAEVTGTNGLDKTLDYVMALDIPAKQLQSKANNAIEGLLKSKGISSAQLPISDFVKVNVLIQGTIDNPKITTSLKDFAQSTLKNIKDAVKDKVKEEVDKKIDEGKDKLKAEADRILSQAQAEADKVKAEANRLADQVHTEGYNRATDVEKKAKTPLEKLGAKKAADTIRKETDKKAQEIRNEADRKANDIMNKARAEVDKLK